MKHLSILAFFLLLIASCSSDDSDSTDRFEKEQQSYDQSCDHILEEAYVEQPSIHYSDPNTFFKERMILHVRIDGPNSLTINDSSAILDNLGVELQKFYFANRNLGPEQTRQYQEDENYAFHNYPFFNYFDKDGFMSFLQPLEKRAELDSMSSIYFQKHKQRLRAFEAVDGERCAFIEFGALISIEYSENTSETRIAEVENKIARTICLSRNEIAQNRFESSYYLIREKALKKDAKAMEQLAYLQEMIPAYIMKKSITSVEN